MTALPVREADRLAPFRPSAPDERVERIRRIRAGIAMSTPGPYHIDAVDDGDYAVTGRGGRVMARCLQYRDATFVQQAAADLAWLCAEVEALADAHNNARQAVVALEGVLELQERDAQPARLSGGAT